MPGASCCPLLALWQTAWVRSILCSTGGMFTRETGLYYLQSRYYDPEIGRFINADAYMSTGDGILGNNMFAYCNNNPVKCYDPSGHGPITALILTSLLCGVISAGADMAGQMFFEEKTFDEIDWRSVAISGTAGVCRIDSRIWFFVFSRTGCCVFFCR